MKEDILEQLVDEFLQLKGYFTIHNVKFHPSANDPGYAAKQDCVDSDVDVIGFNPRLRGHDRVWVVSCKSWQAGFSPKEWVTRIERNKFVSGRHAWKAFRELIKEKWANALIRKVKECTGSSKFTYVTAVTRLKGGERSRWEEHPLFRKNLRRNPILILTLDEILREVFKETKKTVAGSEVGRLVQLMKASGWKP